MAIHTLILQGAQNSQLCLRIPEDKIAHCRTIYSLTRWSAQRVHPIQVYGSHVMTVALQKVLQTWFDCIPSWKDHYNAHDSYYVAHARHALHIPSTLKEPFVVFQPCPKTSLTLEQATSHSKMQWEALHAIVDLLQIVCLERELASCWADVINTQVLKPPHRKRPIFRGQKTVGPISAKNKTGTDTSHLVSTPTCDLQAHLLYELWQKAFEIIVPNP